MEKLDALLKAGKIMEADQAANEILELLKSK
jgi:hypothetical protein